MKEKFNNDIIKLASLLKIYCEEFENKKYRIIDNKGEIYNSPFLFFYTFLLKKDFRKNKYINLLKNYLEKSERFFPGSSFYLCVMFYNFVFKNKKFNKIQKKEKLNKKNIENFFLQFYSKEKLDIFLEIIKFSGPDSTIITKTSKNSTFQNLPKVEFSEDVG